MEIRLMGRLLFRDGGWRRGDSGGLRLPSLFDLRRVRVGGVGTGEWAAGRESFVGGREERGALLATSGRRRSRLRRRLDG